MRWMVLAAFIATPAMAAQQFDLVCTAADVHVHYRIDLVKSQYCFDLCRKVMQINDVSGGEIILYDENTDLPDGGIQYSKVNRLTGEWRWYSFTPRTMAHEQNIVGLCEPRPFSGINQAQKKF